MPSQKVHDVSCLTLAGLLAAGGLTLGRLPLLGMAGGAALGTLIHPDWDYAEIKGVVRELGPFRYLVKPYGFLIPHRSFLSHGPLIGTMGRLAYMLVPLWLLNCLLQGLGLVSANVVGWLLGQEPFWWVAWGLVMADTLHALMDMWVTGAKRFIRQMLMFG